MPPPPPPTASTASVSRDDVLDVAMELLREGGPEALSMRRLAGDLGASTQVVYSRVGGKPEIVRALHDRAFASLRARAADLPRTADTLGDLHALAQSYFDHAVEDPMRFDVMFGAPVAEFVRDDAAREVEAACFADTWVATVRRHLDARDPDRPRGVAVRLAWRLWSAVHGIVTVHLAGHPAPDGDPEAELHAVVDLLLAASRD